MQPILAVHFGSETNISNFSVQVDAMAPVNVGMFQIHRLNKEGTDVNIEIGEQTVLGAMDSAGILAAGMDAGQVYVGCNSTADVTEMEALCRGLYHRSDWFITAQGEVDANVYAHVLMPRKPITVKGIGETYSGVYYVNHVTHRFSGSGYKQFVRMKRNALMPTGDEDFGESGGLLGGL